MNINFVLFFTMTLLVLLLIFKVFKIAYKHYKLRGVPGTGLSQLTDNWKQIEDKHWILNHKENIFKFTRFLDPIVIINEYTTGKEFLSNYKNHIKDEKCSYQFPTLWKTNICPFFNVSNLVAPLAKQEFQDIPNPVFGFQKGNELNKLFQRTFLKSEIPLWEKWIEQSLQYKMSSLQEFSNVVFTGCIVKMLQNVSDKECMIISNSIYENFVEMLKIRQNNKIRNNLPLYFCSEYTKKSFECIELLNSFEDKKRQDMNTKFIMNLIIAAHEAVATALIQIIKFMVDNDKKEISEEECFTIISESLPVTNVQRRTSIECKVGNQSIPPDTVVCIMLHKMPFSSGRLMCKGNVTTLMMCSQIINQVFQRQVVTQEKVDELNQNADFVNYPLTEIPIGQVKI